MMKVFLAVGFALFALFFWSGAVYFLIYALGYRQATSRQATAYLIRTRYRKNAWYGGPRNGRSVPHLVKPEYGYSVEGKQYIFADLQAPFMPNSVPREIVVRYQIRHPQRAFRCGGFPLSIVAAVGMTIPALIFTLCLILSSV